MTDTGVQIEAETETQTAKLGVGAAIAIAVGLVAFGVLIASRSPSASVASAVQPPHLVSMEEGGEVMRQAGEAMKAHGQAMLGEGRRTGDKELIAHGEHWLRDGQLLLEGGRWMAVDPASPSSLISATREQAIGENWGTLVSGSQAMIHEVNRAGVTGSVNLEALRWNGLAMRSEGQKMAEHGAVMAEEVEVMVERHKLQGQAAVELRRAAQAMSEAGGHLERNGQEMLDYVDRLRRSLGYP